MGGAALMLSNRRSKGHRAKYRLEHVVRTNCGTDDHAYGCVFQEEDVERNLGISRIGRKIFKLKWKPYIPDFKQAFEHFCIHAGGRAVVDALEKNLQLSPEHVEASRMTLHRFGNTSSNSLWHEMSYIEAKGRMKRGDRVWEIGFKCNSAVWKCNRSNKAEAMGRLYRPVSPQYPGCFQAPLVYPVNVLEVLKLH
ncbi:hypothetical protein AMTR_s00129p00102500 [Amborella trichopoda]|uniref:Very-long-chain 3-oxoacyl-CoA synthase n=1 Tax=Amborella trichopoda TaxID=13333 RepID=W1NJU9_AMBTC|nr:hypothetical protein AMTR_s00129p00102500 [Amborella trichopoda]